MKYAFKVLLVVTITMIVAVPSGYIAYISGRSYTPSPLAFIPKNSQLIAHFIVGNMTAYLFYAYDSPAVIVEYGLHYLSDLISKAAGNPGSSLCNFTPEFYGTYYNYKIYTLNDINYILKKLDDPLLSILSVNVTSLIPKTLYIAGVSGSMVVAGGLSSVKLSIESSRTENTVRLPAVMQLNANISIVSYVHINNISYFSVNVFSSFTRLNVTFSSQTTASYYAEIIQHKLQNDTFSVYLNGLDLSAVFNVGTTNYLEYIFIIKTLFPFVFSGA